jgi:hypothetical protein
VPLTDAADSVLAHLVGIEGRRPLDTVEDPVEREAAADLRAWYHDVFLR